MLKDDGNRCDIALLLGVWCVFFGGLNSIEMLDTTKIKMPEYQHLILQKLLYKINAGKKNEISALPEVTLKNPQSSRIIIPYTHYEIKTLINGEVTIYDTQTQVMLPLTSGINDGIMHASKIIISHNGAFVFVVPPPRRIDSSAQLFNVSKFECLVSLANLPRKKTFFMSDDAYIISWNSHAVEVINCAQKSSERFFRFCIQNILELTQKTIALVIKNGSKNRIEIFDIVDKKSLEEFEDTFSLDPYTQAKDLDFNFCF